VRLPVFECARCNEMTYSASVGASSPCASCGSERQRVIDGYFDEARRSIRPLDAGDHATLIYDNPGAVAPFCARFLTDGVNAGERVFAGVQEDLRGAVTELLESEVEQKVEWKAPSSIYGNFDADRVVATYEGLIAGESRTTRILAGPDRESVEGVEPAEYSRYEVIAHSIITGHGAIVVCVYDASSVPPDFVDMTERRHGLLVEDGGAVRRNERFEYEPV
jgi:hypothetical protein